MVRGGSRGHDLHLLIQRRVVDIDVKHEIIVTADPAFLLVPENLPKNALELEQLHGDRRLVGVSVREPRSSGTGY